MQLLCEVKWCVRACMSECVCVSQREREAGRQVCVCVCEREREGGRQAGRPEEAKRPKVCLIGL